MAKDGKKAKAGTAAELNDLYPGRIVVPVKVYASEDSDETEDAKISIAEMPIARLGKAWATIAHLRDRIGPDSQFLTLSVEHPELLAMIGVAIRWETARVGMLAPDSLQLVFATVLMVNPGFFALFPAFRDPAPSETPTTPSGGDGEMPSATSGIGATGILSATH